MENIVKKGEIACYKQFIFLTMFSTAIYLSCVNAALCGDGLNNTGVCVFVLHL